ncbi:MAG: hypothetical protein P9L99_20885 [Candidatus Lernaella stagnicola]|nr:hypothetical protein [Candidatus Lernaella stagnicola]
MLTFRRLALYTLLLLPIAYVMGITFAERRIIYYLLMAVLLAPVFFVLVVHETLRKKWPRYQHFIVRRGAWLRKILPIIAKVMIWLILLLPTIILVPIGIGLNPWAFAVFGAILLVLLVLQTWRRADYPAWARLDSLLVIIAAVYLALAAMTFTFLGTSASACDRLAASPYLTPLITRGDIDRAPGLDACFPYDVKSDPDADRLFFTLKQKRSGFLKLFFGQEVANDAIGAMPFTKPDFAAAKLILIKGESTARYPQRITVNPQREEIYVVVLDINGRHTIRVISYAGGLFRQQEELVVEFEPIRAYFNNARNELIVLGYEGDVAKYSLDSRRKIFKRHFDNLGFIGMLDTLVPDRYGHRYYASVVSRYFLLFDGNDFDILKQVDVGVPTIGLDYDRKRHRVYAAATFTREILVLDGDTLAVRDRIPTGTTVRELYFDRTRDAIVTAGYADGLLDVYDAETYRRLGRTFVGKLARGIHVEQQTGRVFVTSSCGLFEVDVDRLIAGD